MPSPPPGWRLRQIARKTLSRGEDDPRPIPHHYLQVLLKHLEKYPKEENFLMDLQDKGGTITCLDCWSEIHTANSEGKLEGLDAFWIHIASRGHQELTAGRLSEQRPAPLKNEPIDSDMNSDIDRATHNSAPPSSLSSPSPPAIKKRIMKTIHFPDGDFEYSTDEDEQPPLDPPMLLTPNTTSSSYNSPFNESTGYSSPFQGPSNYISPSNVPGPSTQTFSPTSSSLFGALGTKRSRRGIRRHDFGGGDVVYLSTDDENVDDRPGASVSKKPRLGGALLKNENGLTKSEISSRAEGSSTGFLQHAGNATLGACRAVANHFGVTPNPQNSQNARSNSGFVPIAQNDPMFEHLPPVQNADAYGNWDLASISQDQGILDLDMSMDWLDNTEFGMPGGLGMGYNAPPILAADLAAAGYDHRPGAGNFNLNSNEEGPMGRMDIGGVGPAQKLKDFFLSAMEDFQETRTVVDAAHKLGLKNNSDLIPGLEVQLMPHQLIAVSWMIEQEAKPDIQGGILADDMGLGKTVQCIATCAKNRPAKDAERKSTLVVAPAALLEQWKAEFRERTEEGLFRVHIHHGKDKLRSVKQVQQYDVVITTYQTLCADFPKDKKEKGKGTATAESNYGGSEGEEADAFGPLASTEWHRVVLDEAQCIRNRRTRASRCVARLEATYRWALTGTPVTNTLADLYGLVRFLQFRPFNDWKEFYEHIARVEGRQPDVAGKRAQALLRKCLLRRTKNTTVEGKPILQLPSKHIEVVEIEFSPEEREIYQKIEERQKQRMSKFIKAGTVMKNYAVVLVMLLRLRQACNHPQLICSDGDEDGERVAENDGHALLRLDTSPEAELERAEQLLGAQFVQEAKAKFREQARARIEAELQGTDVEEEDTDCPICFDTYVNNCRMTGCKHLFCGDCLNDLFKSPPNGMDVQDGAYAEAIQSGTRSCPVCRGHIHPQRVFKISAFEPSAEELDSIRAAANGTPKEIPEIIDLTLDDETPSFEDSKGKGKAVVKEEAAALDDLDLSSLDRGDDFEPSAKMVQMMNLVKEWHETAPEDKIICYSQWTSMISLVEILLGRDNIETVRFDGKMSRMARNAAVTRFKKRDGPSIMLISLKCGGVGLNLVEANRVMCLDLAWNAATENQAFDRVHRMGQQKDVFVKRLIVRNTVEERILNLQARKQSLADAALGEGKAAKIKKMSVGELKALFGM